MSQTLQIYFKDHNGYDGYSWIAGETSWSGLYTAHPKGSVAFLPVPGALQVKWVADLVGEMEAHGIRFIPWTIEERASRNLNEDLGREPGLASSRF